MNIDEIRPEMTGPDLARIRRGMGLSLDQLALKLGMISRDGKTRNGKTNIHRWEKMHHPLPPYLWRALRDIYREMQDESGQAG